jgi:tripartite ATP-independent transporter DctP family solute receptor
VLSLAIVSVLAVVMTACGGTGQSSAESGSEAPETSEPGQSQVAAEFEQRTLTVAYTTPETFPYHDGFTRFKELVEERSGGQITVDLFPGAQLGGERDTEEGLLEGSIQIVLAAGALANFAPIYNLVELPFLIKNQEHMEAIVTSDVGVQLAQGIEEQGGFHVIGWFSTGDSAIQTVDAPIETPDDLNGVKIRVQENPALIDAVTALGGNATPLPFADVYTALQTGVIEGAHLDWNAVNSIKLTELIHYSTTPEIAFLAEPRPVIMSVEYWETLNDAERELIGTAMVEAAEYERAVIVERQDEAVQTVRDAGVEFTEIDEDAFIELVRPVWDKWSDELDAADLIEAIDALRP